MKEDDDESNVCMHARGHGSGSSLPSFQDADGSLLQRLQRYVCRTVCACVQKRRLFGNRMNTLLLASLVLGVAALVYKHTSHTDGSHLRRDRQLSSEMYPEKDYWSRLTTRFAEGYGREGQSITVVSSAEPTPFSLVTLGGMTIKVGGAKRFMGDVSISTNGGHAWTKAPEVADHPLGKRWYTASSVIRVYDLNGTTWDRIVVVGGFYLETTNAGGTRQVYLNDVREATVSITQGNATVNGLAWHWMNTTAICEEMNVCTNTACSSCVFSKRYGHSLVTFGGNLARQDIPRGGGKVQSYLVLIGGRTALGFRSDVWISKNAGWRWTRQSISGPSFSARAYHASVTYGQKLFVFGGRSSSSAAIFNDVWRSTTVGKSWEKMTGRANWPARYAAIGLAFPVDKTFNRGVLGIVGGYQSGSSITFSDFYASADDGASWTNQGSDLPFGARSAASGVVIPRHTPDYWPKHSQNVPTAESGETWYPIMPFVVCGGLSPRTRLNDCWTRRRGPVVMRSGAHAIKNGHVRWHLVSVALLLVGIAF